jgi:hypothetical protein
LDGSPPDAGLATLPHIFPQTYCAFEQIVLLRTTFFTLFNMICANSLCYELDENKLKVIYGQRLGA